MDPRGYHSILLCVDFSESSESAIEVASGLAQRLEASVKVLFVDVLHPPDEGAVEPDGEVAGEEMSHDAVETRLKALAERLTARGIRAGWRCRNSMAIAPAILEEADRLNSDIIVAGTHGRRGMRRLLLGSVTDELLRTAQIPLVLAPTGTSLSVSSKLRMLLPVDFSPSTRPQVNHARLLARALDAEVHILYVNEPLPLPLMFSGVGTLADLMPAVKKEITGEMDALAQNLRDEGLIVRQTMVDGHPSREIVRLAEQDQTDIIVIARHGASRFERLMLGSVTERVARSSTRPVLIFPDLRTLA